MRLAPLFDLVRHLLCPGQDLLRLFIDGGKCGLGLCFQIFDGLVVFLEDALIFKKSLGFKGSPHETEIIVR